MCIFKKKEKIGLRERIQDLKANADKDLYDDLIKTQIESLLGAIGNVRGGLNKKEIKIFERHLTAYEETLKIPQARSVICLDFVFEDMMELLSNRGDVIGNYEKKKFKYDADLVKSDIYRRIANTDEYNDNKIPDDYFENIMRIDYISTILKDENMTKNIKSLLSMKEQAFIKTIEQTCGDNAKNNRYPDWKAGRRTKNYKRQVYDMIKETSRANRKELYERRIALEKEVAKLNNQLNNPKLLAAEVDQINSQRSNNLKEIEIITGRIAAIDTTIETTLKSIYQKYGQSNMERNQLREDVDREIGMSEYLADNKAAMERQREYNAELDADIIRSSDSRKY